MYMFYVYQSIYLDLSLEVCQGLTVTQMKRIRVLIDEVRQGVQKLLLYYKVNVR